MKRVIALVAVDRAECATCWKSLVSALHTAGCLAPLGVWPNQRRLASPGSLAENTQYQKHPTL